MLEAEGIRWQAPEVTFYHNDEYRETDIDMEVAVAVADGVMVQTPVHDELILRRVPGCELAAALTFEGPFESVVGPIQSLLRWVGMHRHAPAGPLREVHLSGPAHCATVTDALPVIELQVPIAPLDATR